MIDETTEKVREAEEMQARLPESLESCKRILRTYRKLLDPMENLLMPRERR